MSVELLYTSAPQGLKQGSRGFCTVLSSQGMPVNLTQRLEGLSGYRHVYQPSHPDARLNPVCYSHIKLTIAGRSVSILSRISDYGVDYSQRTNKLAHHLVLDSSEMAPAGPAWVLRQEQIMRRNWDGKCSTPSAGPHVPQQNQEPAVCRDWERVAGDAGWAGVLAETFHKSTATKPLWIVFDAHQSDVLLKLIDEAIALIPPSERWRATFSTYCTNLPPEADCRVRCVLSGSEEARMASGRGQVIDLTKRLAPPAASDWVSAARSGICPVVRASAPRTSSAAAARQDAIPPTLGIGAGFDREFESQQPSGHPPADSYPNGSAPSGRSAPPAIKVPPDAPLRFRDDPLEVQVRSVGDEEWTKDIWKTRTRPKAWRMRALKYSALASAGLLLFILGLGTGLLSRGMAWRKASDSDAVNQSKPQPAETKPAETKPAETKPAETKPAETKPAETKPAETKPAETKPAETKPAETKPAETKPAETKPAETKPAETNLAGASTALSKAMISLEETRDTLEGTLNFNQLVKSGNIQVEFQLPHDLQADQSLASASIDTKLYPRAKVEIVTQDPIASKTRLLQQIKIQNIETAKQIKSDFASFKETFIKLNQEVVVHPDGKGPALALAIANGILPKLPEPYFDYAKCYDLNTYSNKKVFLSIMQDDLKNADFESEGRQSGLAQWEGQYNRPSQAFGPSKVQDLRDSITNYLNDLKLIGETARRIRQSVQELFADDIPLTLGFERIADASQANPQDQFSLPKSKTNDKQIIESRSVKIKLSKERLKY